MQEIEQEHNLYVRCNSLAIDFTARIGENMAEDTKSDQAFQMEDVSGYARTKANGHEETKERSLLFKERDGKDNFI